MSNLSVNKYQASLSIEELLQQTDPEQHQNWLLTYLDVFVLIIMLVVTLMALNEFETEQQIKRAENLQEHIREITSKPIRKKPFNSPPLHTEQEKPNPRPLFPNETQSQITTSTNLSPNTALLTETTIEYIPQNVNPKVTPTESIKTTVTDTLISDSTKIKTEPSETKQNTDDILQKKLQATVDDLGLDRVVNMKVSKGYAQLEIQDNILFESSESTLLAAGKDLLTKLKPLLSESSGLIYIEGHTDNRPINTAKFPSNWELGSSRATSVLHFLASQKLDASRLRATTYADTKPIADNNTPQGREKNRRVSIVIKVSDKVDYIFEEEI